MQNYPHLALIFLKNLRRYWFMKAWGVDMKKYIFLVFKTKIHKVSNKTFQVDFTLIKHSLKRFFKIIWNSVISFSYAKGLVYLLWWAPFLLIWFTSLSIMCAKQRKSLLSSHKNKNLWFYNLSFLKNKILSKSRSLLQIIWLP